MHARDLKLGARVIVQGNKHGTCRFFGRTKFADGEWVGVELDHAVGKHDGIVEGIRYFQCARANTGIFLRARDVESETDAATESSTSAQSHSPSRYKTHRSRKSRDSTSSTASSSDSIRSPRSTLASPRSTGTPSPRRSHGESPRVRGQHSRTSSDLARVELESLLRRSSFLADKPKMMQDLTRLIARRPSTVEMMRSGILNTGRGVEPLESVNENEASSGGGAEQKIDSAGKPVPTVRVRLGWSAGSRPSVDLDSVDRHMYVFGENSHGELSTGDENHCYLPTEITLPPLKGAKNPANANNASDFAQVCLGLNHMVVLTLANEVLTAGSWVANLLGTDDRQNLNKLKRLRQFEDLRRKNPSNPIISISCGDRHTVALHNDGTCESFGGTLYGKLGHLASGASDNDSMPSSSTYLTISALQGEKVSMMSAGNWHTVCCTTKGEVFTFGGGGKFYNMGQLGHGNTDDSMTPRRVDQFGSMPASKIFVKSICCGGYHTMALTVDRLVYAWGSGKFGQLGLGNDNNFSTPQLVQSLLVRGSGAGRTIGLAAGENHSLCVQADGSVFSWGYGMQGQCGHGLSQNEKFPRKVLFFSRRNSIVVQVDAGWRHSIALTEDNSVYTWGHNDRGQLGLGDTKSHSAPQLVEELEGKGIKTVAAGGNHSLAFNDFFKAAQELVFLQRVREFRQVQGASKIPTLKGANLESALSPRSGSASPNRAVSLASPSNRMSGGGSNLNSPNNASSSSSGSGSGANLLPSPNPLVSAELKHMLREMATETDEELTRRSNANIGLQIEDGSEITPTSAASSAARSGGSIANRSLSYDISANGAPGLLTPRAPSQGNGKGDSADLGADDSFILQQANQAVEQLNDAYPQFVSKSPELENQDVGTAPTVAEIISRSNVPNQRSRGGAQQQRNRSGVTVEDEGDEYRGEDDEYHEEEEAATASEEREDIYENEEHDERKYADDDDEAKSQRKQQRAAHRESGYDHQSSEESSNRVHSSSLRSVTHSASRTRHMSRTSVSFQGSALCIDLVYSPQVHLTHRFMSFQTHTEETAVRDMIQEYMRTVHGERNSTVMLDQLLVTPSNTVSRTSRLTHESQIASSPMPAPSPRSAMRHDHIYEYDAVGPPRYTLQLILSSVDEEENLWPLWAQEFYASLLQLCPDIAEEAKKPATLEQLGLSVAIVDHSSAIMRPCFRELRPPNTR